MRSWRPTRRCAPAVTAAARSAGGTKARLGDLARVYTYYDSHGMPGLARESYAELAEEERDWKDADLIAARETCHHKIDFLRAAAEGRPSVQLNQIP